MSDTSQRLNEPRGHVVLAGVGNVGSPFAMLLAPHVNRLTIIDRDRVEIGNLRNQWFTAADIGRPKAEVIAARIAAMPGGPTVESHVLDLDAAPVGLFETADVVAGGLDSLRARQMLVSERAWPLGLTVVDGGVGDPLLGRVHVLVPGETSGCLECPFGDADYAQLAREMPCTPRVDERSAGSIAPPTASPAFLGTAVASLMVAETLAVLHGRGPTTSREVYVDLESGRLLRSDMRRAQGCRFDHEIVTESLPTIPFEGTTLGDLVDVVRERFPSEPVHLEARPGPLPDGERIATPDSLMFRFAQTLADAGFVPTDRLRVRTHHGSAWLRLATEDDR